MNDLPPYHRPPHDPRTSAAAWAFVAVGGFFLVLGAPGVACFALLPALLIAWAEIDSAPDPDEPR